MLKIFLDANVIFSASNRLSNIHHFLCELSKHHQLVASDYALEEAQRNVYAKRPQWVSSFEELKPTIGLVPNALLLENVALVEKDRPILGAAIAGECDYLLTGDKRDFGHLYGQEISGVTVIDYLGLLKSLDW